MFDDDLDPEQLMAEAEALRLQMEGAQQRLAATEIRGDGANGMVTVRMHGLGQITAVEIHDDAVRSYDALTLGDVVLEAINDAFRQSGVLFKDMMSGIVPDEQLLDEMMATWPGSR